jgi:hypothetical protein
MMSRIQVVVLLIGWTLMLAFIGIGIYATANQLRSGIWFFAAIMTAAATASATYTAGEH